MGLISKGKAFVAILLISVFIISCSDPSKETQQIIIGIESDITTLNPLYTFTSNEGNISELLYLGLFEHDWDLKIGEISSKPLLAKAWEWDENKTSVIVELNDDLFWSDEKAITTDDIIFTFDLYSDPIANGRFLGYYENYFLDETGKIDIEKSFEKISSTKLKINFKERTKPSVLDFDMPILPKHIFEKVERNALVEHVFKFDVVSGPYKIGSWKKNQFISLMKNSKSTLAKKHATHDLVFKIVPDYNSRIIQIKTGELDFIEGIKPIDYERLNSNQKVLLKEQTGREYEYVGWNNMSVVSKNKKHKLFGDKTNRKILSYSINKNLILEEYLNNLGSNAKSPISNIFSSVYNDDLPNYDYNPDKARELLKRNGWQDSDNNGIVDKKGIEFSFELSVPAGNPRRIYAATIIKQNLIDVGIKADIKEIEATTFFNKLFEKEVEAWIAAWVVPIPIMLKPFWYSDNSVAMQNLSGYSNKRVDEIINSLEKNITEEGRIKLLNEFQTLIVEDQPATFMYWIDNLVCYNKNISNIKINPLGTIQHCWQWQLKN